MTENETVKSTLINWKHCFLDREGGLRFKTFDPDSTAFRCCGHQTPLDTPCPECWLLSEQRVNNG